MGWVREGGWSFELYISHALQVSVVKKKKTNKKQNHQMNLIVTTVVKVITDIQVMKQQCKQVTAAAMNAQDSFSLGYFNKGSVANYLFFFHVRKH